MNNVFVLCVNNMLESLVHDILLFISGNVILGFNLLNSPSSLNRIHFHSYLGVPNKQKAKLFPFVALQAANNVVPAILDKTFII